MSTRKSSPSRPLASLLFVGVLSACSSPSASRRDLGDGGLADQRVDVVADQAADGAEDGSVGPDFPVAGEGVLDFPVTDARLSTARVLYITTKDVHAFGLREVTADGQSAPKPVPGFAGLIDFGTLLLTGLGEQISIDRSRPWTEELVAFTRIRLPDGGALYYFHRTLTASSGILQVDGATGALRVLHEVPGLYADVLGPHVAIDAARTLAATVSLGRQAALLRLDGTVFPDGKVARLLDAPAEVAALESSSLTFAGGFLYLVGRRSDGRLALLRADVTAGTLLAEVPLGAIGSEPRYVASELVLADDGSTLVLRAGPDYATLDLYRVVAATAQMQRITQVATTIEARGDRFGGTEGRLAISPKGSRVAYVVAGSGEQLYLRASDGSGPTLNPTAEPTFATGGLSALYNVVFIDEDRLLFMGGVGPFQLDVYYYDAKANTLSNLTGVGSKTPPFDGLGGFSPRAAWIDRAAGWCYLVLYDTVTTEQDIFAISLAPSAVGLKQLTSGRRLGSQPGDFALCPQSKRLYFAARPEPAKYAHELWQVDLLAGGVAQPLSAVSGAGPWIFSDLVLAPDCSRLVASGGPYYGEVRLWSMEASSPATLRPITAVPQVLGSLAAVTPDGSTVVYSSGGSPEAMTVKSVLSIGSASTTLDSTGGTTFVLGTFP